MTTVYTYMWEFLVPEENRLAFESHYGRGGTWEQLFRSSRGYLGTSLLVDCTNVERYVTVDRWESKAAYAAFRSASGDAYDALDRRCEGLASTERSLGAFLEAAS
jgi:heme-degrading monooxygenase HmoA